MKLKKQKKNGITLIALMITIIILLILVGIIIAGVKNNNLFNNAQLAKKRSDEAQNEENSIFDDYNKKITEAKNGGKIKAEDVGFTPADSNWKVTNVKEALDYLFNY